MKVTFTKEESRRIIDTAKALKMIEYQTIKLKGLGIRFQEITKPKKECEEEAEKRYSGCGLGINNERRAFLDGALFGSNNE